MTKIIENMDRAERIENVKNIIVTTYFTSTEGRENYINALTEDVVKVLDKADSVKSRFDSHESFQKHAVNAAMKVLWLNFSGGTTAEDAAAKIVNLYFR